MPRPMMMKPPPKAKLALLRVRLRTARRLHRRLLTLMRNLVAEHRLLLQQTRRGGGPGPRMMMGGGGASGSGGPGPAGNAGGREQAKVRP